jgi:hypothetical protein
VRDERGGGELGGGGAERTGSRVFQRLVIVSERKTPNRNHINARCV